MSKGSNKISQQEQAIQDYLKSLMLVDEDENAANESTTSEDHPTVPRAESTAKVLEKKVPLELPIEKQQEAVQAQSAVIGIEQLVAEIPDTVTQIVSETVSESKIQVTVDADTDTKQDMQPQLVEEALQADTGVPDWAETRFQCLLFKVSGLSLAVPLVKLNSVIPWDENITETPNQTDWYLGLVQHLQNQVKVIDTALLVMPENRRQNIENETEKRLSHILLVDDYKWGLACSSIGDVIWMSQDEVKWRKNKTSRAWLSGTSLEHLCAIMDTEVFAKMLPD